MTTTSTAKPTLTLQSLRDRYSAIDDSLWCIKLLGNEHGQRCAVGHLLQDTGNRTHRGWMEFEPLTLDVHQTLGLFEPLRASLPETVTVSTADGTSETYHRDNVTVLAMVANGDHPLYQQETPKARVLTAIDDLIAMTGAPHDP